MKARLVSALFLSLLLQVPVVDVSVRAESASTVPVTFYFHGFKLMLAAENRSMFIFDRADPSFPSRMEPIVVECSVEIRQVVDGIPGWVGGVAWGAPELLNDTRISGRVTFRCWLSSDVHLWFWELSGVAVGVSEVDSTGRVVWGPKYVYQYSLGNKLSSAPEEHSLTVDVDHLFKAGNHILFGVVVGSTRQGWQAKVHFDSADFASRAVMPLERR
jgi:hypothetical protein